MYTVCAVRICSTVCMATCEIFTRLCSTKWWAFISMLFNGGLIFVYDIHACEQCWGYCSCMLVGIQTLTFAHMCVCARKIFKWNRKPSEGNMCRIKFKLRCVHNAHPLTQQNNSFNSCVNDIWLQNLREQKRWKKTKVFWRMSETD